MKTTNDSILLSKKYTKTHTEQTGVENYIKMIKLAYLKNKFIFDKNGNFNQTSDLAIFKSKYKVNKDRNLIEVKDSGLKGENVKFEMPFKILKKIIHNFN